MTAARTNSWIGATLGVIAAPTLRQGWALAWICAAAQLAGMIVLGLAGAGWAIMCFFLIAHGFFVAAMTDFGMRLARDPDVALYDSLRPGVIAGLVLAAPMLALPWLDPSIPWLGFYWVAITVSAAPARLTALLRGARIRLWPLWQRLPLVALGALPILLLPLEPTPSSGEECCGLFEGGLFLMPILGIWVGLWLFGASILAVLISAASVRPSVDA